MEDVGASEIKAPNLNFFDFFDFEDEQKIIQYNMRRYVIADAGFVGILHRELVRVQGWRRSRSILMRLGYAAGYTECQTMRKAQSWDSDKDLLLAGMAFHSMKGLGRTTPDVLDLDRGKGVLRIEGTWEDSQEAHWHQHFLGAAPAPVCWLFSGYMSGFTSALWGDEVLVREVECSATGRVEECRYVGKPAGEWDEDATEDLDILRYPALGSDLSKMGEQPSVPDLPTGADRPPQSGDVFRLARTAGIIGRSKALEGCLKLALQVSATDATVLLVGESGTGKELFAHLIHGRSPRVKSPFIAVNCSALPETLLESELFGHVKGSFTGAVGSRKGLFEAAHMGTILLDEIGEMTPATQVKLLRVLQEKEVRPVGGNRGTSVDVRIIAATNRDLDRMVAEGRFREDLYYRLKVFPIEITPLRGRREDVVPLARHFLSRFSRTTGKRVNSLTPEALKTLTSYHWPGNVRELENMLERAVVLTSVERIREEDLPIDASGKPADPLREPEKEPTELKAMEKRHILRVLAREGGHRQRTAKALKIGVNTLWRKLKEYGVVAPGGRGGKD